MIMLFIGWDLGKIAARQGSLLTMDILSSMAAGQISLQWYSNLVMQSVFVKAHGHKPFFKEMPDLAEKRPAAMWLDRDIPSMSGRILRLPERGEIDGNLNEQLIVEYYSR